MPARKLKVFLCHSSGDKPAVRVLYQRLQADGFEPWLDEEDLLIGQLWEEEIPQAVRTTDAIVVCLSQSSTNKEGYVQKEIAVALDVAAEKPEGSIFLMPLKLEVCEIPMRLKRWHFGMLYEERGYEKLCRSLTLRAESLGLTVAPLLPSASTVQAQPTAVMYEWEREHVPAAPPPVPPLDNGGQSEARGDLSLASSPSPSPVIVPPPILAPTFRNSIGMEFALIPAGEFRMGSENGFDSEKPVHLVRITKPFYLGKYQVTQGQWQAVMGNNPSHFTGDPQRPVERVSWEDTQEFLRRLGEKDGKPYRLPTEAEWEYAARAGSTGAYCFGDDESQLKDYAWYDANAKGTTHPVGQLKPNAWGLYDVHGNVWEWCHDGQRTYTSENVSDPLGPTTAGSDRVIRGGGWNWLARHVRSAFRRALHPGLRSVNLGVRCASSV